MLDLELPLSFILLIVEWYEAIKGVLIHEEYQIRWDG